MPPENQHLTASMSFPSYNCTTAVKPLCYTSWSYSGSSAHREIFILTLHNPLPRKWKMEVLGRKGGVKDNLISKQRCKMWVSMQSLVNSVISERCFEPVERHALGAQHYRQMLWMGYWPQQTEIPQFKQSRHKICHVGRAQDMLSKHKGVLNVSRALPPCLKVSEDNTAETSSGKHSR